MKFWQTLDPKIFKQLELLAQKRGIEVQAYIRAIVIPEHLQSLPKPIVEKKYSKRAKKAWATRRKNAKAPYGKQVTPEPLEVRKEPLPSDQSS